MAQSRGGSQDLGGGQSYEAEAKSVMEYSLRHLSENFVGHLKQKKINIENFRNSVLVTVILSCPSLPKIDGLSERDAVWQKINDKKKVVVPDSCKVEFEKLIGKFPLAEYLIIINISSWQRMDALQKRILMIHEALGISNHYDSDYLLSSNLSLIFQTTLIPPSAKVNIYHEIRFAKPWRPGNAEIDQIYPDIWDLYDYQPTDTIDGIFQFVRFCWYCRNIFWTRDETDPRFETSHIYFQLKDTESDYFNREEWLKSRKCEDYLQSRQALNFIIVGEINRTIVDCGLKKN